MALKLLKVLINLEVKGDVSDPDDLRDRVNDALQLLVENDELEFTLGEDEEELEGEDS